MFQNIQTAQKAMLSRVCFTTSRRHKKLHCPVYVSEYPDGTKSCTVLCMFQNIHTVQKATAVLYIFSEYLDGTKSYAVPCMFQTVYTEHIL
jgi:hypothetical protein